MAAIKRLCEDSIAASQADPDDSDAASEASLATGVQLYLKKPKVIVLCGSSRFVDVMAVCAWVLERDEGAIAMGLHLLPAWYPDCPADHLAEHEGVADNMDTLHLRKIDMAHEVFVVDFGKYTGDSTNNEIRYARELGIPVRFFSDDPVGQKVLLMIDEYQARQRELNEKVERVPDGTPGVRDQDNPCDEFDPGQPGGNCHGDGHALCRECVEYEPRNTDDDTVKVSRR